MDKNKLLVDKPITVLCIKNQSKQTDYYTVFSPSLPNAVVQGDSIEEIKKSYPAIYKHVTKYLFGLGDMLERPFDYQIVTNKPKQL